MFRKVKDQKKGYSVFQANVDGLPELSVLIFEIQGKILNTTCS